MKANISQLCFVVLSAMLLFSNGCISSAPKAKNPLEGWKSSTPLISDTQLPKSIADDYKDYIKQLPENERKYISSSSIWIYEDGTGQRAVQIQIPLNGTWWEHDLIYDQGNKRIKTIKYANGRYSC